MFPTGPAGIALVVLRSVVAATVLVDANRYWRLGSASIVDVLVALVTLLLLLGFLTPYSAAISCLLESAFLLSTGTANRFQLGMSALTAGVAAVLGPGAYSLDSRILGRRLITLPPKRDH
jgi:hypothetical protein